MNKQAKKKRLNKSRKQKGLEILDLAMLIGLPYTLTEQLRAVYGKEDVYNMLKLRRDRDIISHLKIATVTEPKDWRTKRTLRDDKSHSAFRIHLIIINWLKYMDCVFCETTQTTKLKIISSYVTKNTPFIFRYDNTMSYFHTLLKLPSTKGFINLSLLLHIYATLKLINDEDINLIKQIIKSYFKDSEVLFIDRLNFIEEVTAKRKRSKKEQQRYNPDIPKIKLTYDYLYRDALHLAVTPTIREEQRRNVLKNLFS